MPCGWRHGWGDLSTVDKLINASVYNWLVSGVQGFFTFGVLRVLGAPPPSPPHEGEGRCLTARSHCGHQAQGLLRTREAA